MENKKYKDKNIYLLTIAIVIIVYLIIHIYNNIVKEDINLEKQGYEHNTSQEPINNIIALETEPKEEVLFLYDYDPNNHIYLINQFPTKDEVGKSLQGAKSTQDFKIRFNSEAVGVRYVVTIEKLDGTDLEENWAKTFLVRNGVDVKNCFRTDGKIKTFDEYKNYRNNPKEKVLYEGVVTSAQAKRGYEEYTFRMWISEDVEVFNEDYLSKTFKSRINVHAHG